MQNSPIESNHKALDPEDILQGDDGSYSSQTLSPRTPRLGEAVRLLSPGASPDGSPTKAARDRLSFPATVATLTTWCTSSAIIGFPFAFGQLGYILAPLILIAWGFISLVVAFFVVDVARDTSATTLGEVGYVLAGKWGRRAAVWAQLGNLLLFMPTALVIIAGCVQYIAPSSALSCDGVYTVIICGVLYLVLQVVRSFSHAAILAFLTTLLAIIKACALLPYSFVHYSENSHVPLSFGAPGGNWADYGLAISALAYSICPIFIQVELLAEVREPQRFKAALVTSTVLMSILYIVAGATGVAFWGWDVEDPVTLMIPRGGVGILLNVLLALATAWDYGISSLVLTNAIGSYFPRWPWAAKSLPPTLFTLLLACSIPSFEDLVGILTGVTIVSANTYAITLPWALGDYVEKRKTATIWGSRSWLHVATLVGVPLSAYIVAASLYFATTIGYSSNFFCDG